jgi:hypothetical protein
MRRDRRDSDREQRRGPPPSHEDFKEATAGEQIGQRIWIWIPNPRSGSMQPNIFAEIKETNEEISCFEEISGDLEA